LLAYSRCQTLAQQTTHITTRHDAKDRQGIRTLTLLPFALQAKTEDVAKTRKSPFAIITAKKTDVCEGGLSSAIMNYVKRRDEVCKQTSMLKT
jgi:hypothetical protein